MRRVFGLFALLLVASCDHAAPTASTIATADFTGDWGGGLSRTIADTETVFLRLKQQPFFLLPPGKGAQEMLTGTWSMFTHSGAPEDSGTVTGTAWSESDPVSLTLDDAHGCVYSLSGTRLGAWAISGTVAASGCGTVQDGAFGMTKLGTIGS
ncbi:MAG TPA: hypothetical protein VF737_13405 [Gemmatimonadaceae bacterium]